MAYSLQLSHELIDRLTGARTNYLLNALNTVLTKPKKNGCGTLYNHKALRCRLDSRIDLRLALYSVSLLLQRSRIGSRWRWGGYLALKKVLEMETWKVSTK